jgi:hypothetical protein
VIFCFWLVSLNIKGNPTCDGASDFDQTLQGIYLTAALEKVDRANRSNENIAIVARSFHSDS